MIHDVEVVVIGAGPAGSLAARQLALQGTRVLLVDQRTFPRPKVCGTCLNRHALSVLSQVGLGTLVDDCEAETLTGFRVGGWGRNASLRLPAGRSLSRDRFDVALIEAAQQAGVEFRPGVRATLGTEGSVQLRTGEHIQPIAIVDACGLGGLESSAFTESIAPHSRIGLGAHSDDADAPFAPGTIHMAVGTGGYVGIVRQEDGRLNLAAAFDPAIMRDHGGPGAMAVAILDQAGMSYPMAADLEWRGTKPLTRRVTPVAAGGIFRIGDAAGYVEPFTGEGMAWALAGAVRATRWIMRYVREPNIRWEKAWTREHGQIVGRRQLVCRAIAATLQRPWLAKPLIGLLHAFPIVAWPFVRQLNHPLTPTREGTSA